MDKQITAIGCFKVGSKVFVGNGKKIREITGFRIGSGCNRGQTFATFKGCVDRDLHELRLAGPNGDGIGA